MVESMTMIMSRGYSDIRVWTTLAEMEFLEKIGTFSSPENRGGDSLHRHRIKCLKGYLDNIDLRTDWGRIDKTRVREKAERELNKELYLYDKKGGNEA